MALSSTSRVQLRYIKETTFGETPVAGNCKNLRMTGESLNYTLSKESSAEINADRAVSSMIAVSAEANGSVNGEMQFAEYDPLIEAALQSTFSPYGTAGVGASFSGTFATGTITAAVAPTGNSAFTVLQRGQWFTVTGTGTANDNKLFRVSKTTAPTSTVITLDAGTPAIAGGPYASTVVRAARLTNGTTQPSFSIEREVGDVGEFFLFRGMTVSSMNMSISSGALSTVDFAFMGRDSLQDSVTMLPGTPVASQSYQIMSGVAGSSCALWAGGAPLTGTFVNSISMSYDNALRMQRAICALGSVGIGVGTISATFDLEVYFASGATFYNEFLNNTNMEVSFTAFDVDGNGYVFTLPSANISSYTLNADGKDADLMAQISLTALLDSGNAVPALRKVMFIDRVGAALVA